MNYKITLSGLPEWEDKLVLKFYITPYLMNHRSMWNLVEDYAYRSWTIRMVDSPDEFSHLDITMKFDESVFDVPGINKADLHNASRLYFDPACKIPRAVIARKKFKKALSPKDADAVIVPEYLYIHRYSKAAIFRRDDGGFIYLDLLQMPDAQINLDMTIAEVYDLYSIPTDCMFDDSKDIWNKYKDCKCVYVGATVWFDDNSRWMIKCLDGVYKSVVTEKELMKYLETEANDITEEMADTLMDMLSSKDSNTCLNGLKLMASLNYTKYQATCCYLLASSINGWCSKAKKPYPTSVTFMFSVLKPRLANAMWALGNVTADELPIISKFVKKEIENSVNSMLRGWREDTNLDINFKYEVNIKQKE